MKGSELSIVDSTDSMIESLGISEARALQITRLIKHASIDHDRVTDAAAEVSKKLNGPNELFMLGVIVGQNNGPSAKIEELIEGLKGKLGSLGMNPDE